MPVARFVHRSTRAFGAALLFSLLTASTAWADEWDALFTRAIAAKERALDNNDPATWQEALDLFQQADRVRATKEVEYELASAAARLKQDDVAVQAFEAALALGLDGAAKDKARAFIDEKAPGLARLAVTGPVGAEVSVNGRARGRLPLQRPLWVFAGERRIRARLDDDTAERHISVAPGASARVDFGMTLVAAAGVSPPPTSPPVVDRPPPVVAPPAKDHSLAWGLTLGGGGVAILGGVSAIVAGSNIDSHRSRLSDLCAVSSSDDSCKLAKTGKQRDAQDEVDSIATWKAVRTTGFVGLGAGVLTAGIGVVLLLSDREEPTRTVSVVPLRGGAALSFGGRL